MSDELGQTVGAAETGRDAQSHFGLTELGLRRGVTEVASHGQLAATAEAEAVDGSDDGYRQRLDLAKRDGTEFAELVAFLLIEVHHLGDVGTGHEGLLAVACDDEDTRLGSIEVTHEVVDLLQDSRVERVQRLGRRHFHDGDQVVLLNLQETVVHVRGD